MEPFTKILKLGTVKIEQRVSSIAAPVYCKVAWKRDLDERERCHLSITGVEGPLASGNARGVGGQLVLGYLADLGASITPGEGWTGEGIATFLRAWDRWHLNDMRAGAPDQEEALRAAPPTPGLDHYGRCQEVLARLGLLESKHEGEIYVLGTGLRPALGYKYGHGWVRETIPDDVLAYFRELPETSDRPAWV